MLYLIGQIFLCLLLAALLGGLIGWLLRSFRQQARIDALEHEWSERHYSLETDHRRMSETHAGLDKKYRYILGEHKLCGDKLHQAQATLEQANQDHATATEKSKEFSRRAKELSVAIASRDESIATLEKNLAVTSTSHSDLESTIAKLTAETKRLEEQLAERTKALDSQGALAAEQRETLEARNLELAAKLAERSEACTRFEDDALSLKTRLTTHVSDLEGARNLLRGTQEELDGAKEGLDRKDRELSEVKSALTQVQSELEASQKSQAESQAAAKDVHTTLETLQATVKEGENRLAASEENLAAAQSNLEEQGKRDRAQLDDLTSQTGHLKGELQAVQADRDALRSELKRLEQERDQALADATQGESLRGKNQALEADIVSLRSGLQSLELERNRAQADASELLNLRRSLTTLQNDLSNRDAALTQTKSALSACEQLQAERVARIAELESAKTQLEEQVPLSPSDRPAWLLTKPEGAVDDLKRIWGVGPVLEKTMNELGIFHFRQIAVWKRRDIDWISSHIDAFPDRIERDEWVVQAGTLHQEKYNPDT